MMRVIKSFFALLLMLPFFLFSFTNKEDEEMNTISAKFSDIFTQINNEIDKVLVNKEFSENGIEVVIRELDNDKNLSYLEEIGVDNIHNLKVLTKDLNRLIAKAVQYEQLDQLKYIVLEYYRKEISADKNGESVFFSLKSTPCYDAYEAKVTVAVLSMYTCAGQAGPSSIESWCSIIGILGERAARKAFEACIADI